MKTINKQPKFQLQICKYYDKTAFHFLNYFYYYHDQSTSTTPIIKRGNKISRASRRC